MQGILEVIDGGFGNSLQDLGRPGFRHMGIAASGCLDPILARCANALAGNGPEQACIEIRVLGPTLKLAQGRLRVALAGDVSATLRRCDGTSETIPAWRSLTLGAGDELKIASIKGGTAYLAIAGGVRTVPQLGSRSTYMRAQIGGIDGRLLMKGQQLPVSIPEDAVPEDVQATPWVHAEGPIRVIPGPQAGHFKPESSAQFQTCDYLATTQMDRMGVRLEGPPLEHLTPQAADIVSDGVTPGAIQVPANGQPIVLLADCQTVGGYPKIATVITADLPRFGQLKAGQPVRFCAVDAVQARQALLDLEARWAGWAEGIRRLVPVPVRANLQPGESA